MLKHELISAVAAKSGQTKEQVRATLDATRDVVLEAVAKREPVFFIGLGKIDVITKPGKVHSNIRSGVATVDPAKNIVAFAASSGLQKLVNA